MSHAPFAPRPHRKGAEDARKDIDAKIRTKKPDTDLRKLMDIHDDLKEEEEEFIKDDGRILSLESALKKVEDAIEVYRASADTSDNSAAMARLEVSQGALKGALAAMRDELSELQKELEEVERDIRNIEESEKNTGIIAAELRMNSEVPVSLLEAYEGYEHASALLETAIAEKGRELGMEGVRAMQETILPFWDQHAAFFEEVKKKIAAHPGGGLEFPLEDYPVFEPGAIGPFTEAITRLDMPGEDTKAIAMQVENILRAFIKARAELAANPKDLFGHLLRLEEAAANVARIPSLWEVAYAPKEIKARTQLFAKAEQEIRETSRPSLIQAEQHLRASLRKQPKDLDTLAEALSDVFSDAADPAVRPAKQQEIRDRLEGFVVSMDRAAKLGKEQEGFVDARRIIDKLVGDVAEIRKTKKDLTEKQGGIHVIRTKVFDYLAGREMLANGRSERERLEAGWSTIHERELHEAGIQFDTAKRELGKIELALATRERTLNTSEKGRELEEIKELLDFVRTITLFDPDDAVEKIKQHHALLSKIKGIHIDGKTYTGTSLLETMVKSGAEKPLATVPRWLPREVRNLSMDLAYSNDDPTGTLIAAHEFERNRAMSVKALEESLQAKMRNAPKEEGGWRTWFKSSKTEKEEQEVKLRQWRDEVALEMPSLLVLLQDALKDATEDRKRVVSRLSHAVGNHHPDHGMLLEQSKVVQKREKELKDAVGALGAAVAHPSGYQAPQLFELAYTSLRHVVQHLTDVEPPERKLEPEAFNALGDVLEQAFILPPGDMDALSRIFTQRSDEIANVAGYAQGILPGQIEMGDEIGKPKLEKELEELTVPVLETRAKRDERQKALDDAAAKVARLRSETLETRLAAFDRETADEVEKLDPDGVRSGEEEARIQQSLEELAKRAVREMTNIEDALDILAEQYADKWIDHGARDVVTLQATELEKTADAALRAEAAKLFALFELQGATSAMNGTQLKAWYNKLKNDDNGAGMRALINKLIKART